MSVLGDAEAGSAAGTEAESKWAATSLLSTLQAVCSNLHGPAACAVVCRPSVHVVCTSVLCSPKECKLHVQLPIHVHNEEVCLCCCP